MDKNIDLNAWTQIKCHHINKHAYNWIKTENMFNMQKKVRNLLR